MNLLAVFTTGLFTGALTCMAVQGGLLATTIAQREEEKLQEKTRTTGNALPILAFLISKLAAYTVLGLLLGWLGSVMQLSLQATIWLQFAVGIFMVGTALNLLNVHPIFRYFVIQPPKFVTRMVRNQSKSKDFFAPAVLGAFTVLIPCGTTQAMMALAIASGNPISGAAIMFAFVLGTSPLFFALGYGAAKLGQVFQDKFMRAAAYAMIALAIFNLNSAIALTGSSFTLENIWREFYCTISYCDSVIATNAQGASKSQQIVGQVAAAAVEQANITIESSGYNPDNLSIKAGSQVTLNLTNTGGTGCTQAFTIPKLGIQKIVPVGTSATIEFTAPSQPGQLAFMCSMGMFRGVINIV